MLSACRGVEYAQMPPVCGYVVKTIFDIDPMTVAKTPKFRAKDKDSMLLGGNLSQIFTVVKNGMAKGPKIRGAANLAEG